MARHMVPFVLLFDVFIFVEGMIVDRSAHFLQSVGRSLKVAWPMTSGGRPQG
jgi:hypothetical protein